MKKIIALLLAAMMVVGMFAACGNTNAPAETEAPAAQETEAPAETEAQVTEITLKVWAPQEDQVNEDSWLIQVQ